MMNKLFKLKSILLLFSVAIFITSCGEDNDEIFTDPGDDTPDGVLKVLITPGVERNITINTSGITGTEASVKIQFESTNSMRRLYVTQNVEGQGAQPYSLSTGGVTVDEKADGSLDLSGASSNDFDFTVPLPIPQSANSDIVYTIWATTNRGDFRDPTKRNAFDDNAVGTITIINGSGSTANGIRTFSQTILAAPQDDGSSETFMSLYNGEKYVLIDGDETAALWDFGYYYGASGLASIASTSNYPALFNHDDDTNTPLVAIATLTGVDQAELNNFYITSSSLDYDAITSASDLNGISTPTTERVNQLSVDDVLEFVDEYGNKGVMKVTSISTGFGGSITVAIKVQI